MQLLTVNHFYICRWYIRTPPDQQLLQRDLDNLLSWSTSSNLHFYSSKSCHLSFNQKTSTSYDICTISDNIIVTKQSHKDLGVITLSNNLEGINHHEIILSKAYKTLGLVQRTFSSSISSLIKVKLYISLIKSQLMYCSPIWRPHLTSPTNVHSWAFRHHIFHQIQPVVQFNINNFISFSTSARSGGFKQIQLI